MGQQVDNRMRGKLQLLRMCGWVQADAAAGWAMKSTKFLTPKLAKRKSVKTTENLTALIEDSGRVWELHCLVVVVFFNAPL